jgi:hypothetical protein
MIPFALPEGGGTGLFGKMSARTEDHMMDFDILLTHLSAFDHQFFDLEPPRGIHALGCEH